jgi:phage shock protein C
MQTAQTDIQAAPLPLRNDTILGVCEGIGEDFGFNANWLRLVFASTFYFAPVAVVGAYVGLGLVVAASRYFAPKQIAARQAEHAEQDQVQLPLAA